jgi:hypothetical protein
MYKSNNPFECDTQTDRMEKIARPIFPRLPQSRKSSAPSRKEWEERLSHLLSRLEGLERAILEGEQPTDAPRSPLRAQRDELLTRVADLRWLISCSKA